MSGPLNLEAVKAYRAKYGGSPLEAALLTEVEDLRAQIAAIRALADEYWGRATEATSLSPSWRSVCRDIRAALDGGAA